MEQTPYRWIGRPVRRKEAPALLTGEARFVADEEMAGMLHMAVLRSPHTHARILAVDATKALELPGVAAVITGADAARRSRPLGAGPPPWVVRLLPGP